MDAGPPVAVGMLFMMPKHALATSGVLVSWEYLEGAIVKQGDTVCVVHFMGVVEKSGAFVDVKAPCDGKLATFKNNGDGVAVGAVLGGVTPVDNAEVVGWSTPPAVLASKHLAATKSEVVHTAHGTFAEQVTLSAGSEVGSLTKADVIAALKLMPKIESAPAQPVMSWPMLVDLMKSGVMVPKDQDHLAKVVAQAEAEAGPAVAQAIADAAAVHMGAITEEALASKCVTTMSLAELADSVQGMHAGVAFDGTSLAHAVHDDAGNRPTLANVDLLGMVVMLQDALKAATKARDDATLAAAKSEAVMEKMRESRDKEYKHRVDAEKKYLAAHLELKSLKARTAYDGKGLVETRAVDVIRFFEQFVRGRCIDAPTNDNVVPSTLARMLCDPKYLTSWVNVPGGGEAWRVIANLAADDDVSCVSPEHVPAKIKRTFEYLPEDERGGDGHDG